MLTQRQETFCQEYFKTKDSDASYIVAGYSPKFAENNVHQLLKLTKVQDRMAELNAKTVSIAVMTVGQRKERLSNIANIDIKEPVTAGESVKAIAELNKMDGAYAPEKHAIIGDILIEVVYIDRDKNKNTSRAASTAPASR